ncbi:MAG: 2-phospho-L-lactate guanylyltransferase [Archaeoglobi archaeon]|nr:2-phospho-L-lactate guanylyltransferase [Candidatus Mnemosynella bozhongmuii]
MEILIPHNTSSPKSRLSELMTEEERREFAELMLQDVLTAVKGVGSRFRVLKERGELNEILKESIRDQETLILMSDLPLVSEDILRGILSNPSEVVIAPGRRGGTNAILLRRAFDFEFQFEGASFIRHILEAMRKNMSVSIYDSFYLSCDIDYPSDLIDLWIHGRGKSAEYLRERFILDERAMTLRRIPR